MPNLALLPSDHTYYFKKGDSKWHFRYIHWRGPALEAFSRASCKQDAYLLNSKPHEAEIRKLKTFRETRSETDPNPWQNVSDALEILIPVLKQASRADLLGEQRALGSVAEAGTTRLTDPITIDPGLSVDQEGWAKAQGLSQYQLYRRVKSHTGMSPKEVRNRQRFKEALRFLKKPSISIKDTSILSGFSSQNYFTRFFKKHTGFSPSEWRRLFIASNG